MRRVFKNVYVIAGIIVFLLLFLVMVFGVKVSWSEAALYSAVLTVVGIGAIWWKEHVW